MTKRQKVCLACKGKGHHDTGIAILHCNWCKGTGYIESPIFEFDLIELQALYRIIEHQYIPYNDEDAHAVINKITTYMKEAKKS